MSTCNPDDSTIKKLAVCIGITYKDTQYSLDGPYVDALWYKNLLVDDLGFKPNDIRVLSDADDKTIYPSKENILDNLRWLFESASEGDQLVLTYAGHGSQVEDLNGDENDGFDECLVPADCWARDEPNIILDDELGAMLSIIHPGAYLTCFFDCCHSGTMLELVHCIDPNAGNLQDKVEKRPDRKKIDRKEDGFAANKPSADQSNTGSSTKSLIEESTTELLDRIRMPHEELVPGRARSVPTEQLKAQSCKTKEAKVRPPSVCKSPQSLKAKVFKFGACTDDQTAMEFVMKGEAHGAMSICVKRAFEKVGFDVTYRALFMEIHRQQQRLKKKVPKMDQAVHMTFSPAADPQTDMFLNGEIPSNTVDGEDMCASRACECVLL